MCVAVPFKIKAINGTKGIMESLGVITEVDLSLIDAPKPGDYVLIHAGIAITKMNPADAEETLECFKEIMKESDCG